MHAETIENYCKAVLEIDEGQGAKSIEIANALGISKISVSITLAKLRNEGYIQMKKYGRVKLTKKGMCIAKRISGKHKNIEEFLEKCLGVKKERALKEACAMEHRLSDDTVKKLVAFCKKRNKKAAGE